MQNWKFTRAKGALAVQAKEVLYIIWKTLLSFPLVSVMLFYSIACSVLWCWGMGNGQIWGNWESLVSIYTTSAHKSTHCCSNGRTGTIPSNTTHPAKSNQVFCLPQLPHYLAVEYIQVTNYILPWMRDLHSADVPIATTQPITSHNECLQVVKSSAIAKHLTEWPDILWKHSHTPGIQQSWDSTGCSRQHM